MKGAYSVMGRLGIFLGSVVLVVSKTGLKSENPCVKESLCTCETKDGVYDLGPLGKLPNMRTTALLTSFVFNPCKTFNDGDDCKDVLMCQEPPFGEHRPMASTEGATFSLVDGKMALEYRKRQYLSYVTLVCDENVSSPKFEYIKKVRFQPIYYFKLTSKYSCEYRNATTSPRPASSTPKSTPTGPRSTTRPSPTTRPSNTTRTSRPTSRPTSSTPTHKSTSTHRPSISTTPSTTPTSASRPTVSTKTPSTVKPNTTRSTPKPKTSTPTSTRPTTATTGTTTRKPTTTPTISTHPTEHSTTTIPKPTGTGKTTGSGPTATGTPTGSGPTGSGKPTGSVTSAQTTTPGSCNLLRASLLLLLSITWIGIQLM